MKAYSNSHHSSCHQFLLHLLFAFVFPIASDIPIASVCLCACVGHVHMGVSIRYLSIKLGLNCLHLIWTASIAPWDECWSLYRFFPSLDTRSVLITRSCQQNSPLHVFTDSPLLVKNLPSTYNQSTDTRFDLLGLSSLNFVCLVFSLLLRNQKKKVITEFVIFGTFFSLFCL